jgi:branched-subunit amino acid aminotransferase/4-amino-4-deoxychorismate lyase
MVLVLELRASCLVSRRSTAWATPPVEITILMGITLSLLISLCMRVILTILFHSMCEHKMAFQFCVFLSFFHQRFIIFIVKIFYLLG